MIIRFFSGVLLLLFGCCCLANGDNSLDQGRVMVTDRSAQQFQSGLLAAYEQVMIKQSGNPAIMTIPQVQNSIDRLQNNVVRYRYFNRNDATWLQVTFDAVALRQILASSGQAVLGSDRPLTLLMLLRDDTVMDAAALPPQLLDENAFRYGLRVLLPMMDLQDQLQLGQINQQLTAAQFYSLSQRYRVSSILCGVIAANRVRWYWWQPDAIQQWVTVGDDMAVLVQQGMEKLLVHFAGQYALLASQNLQSDVLLRVNGVFDLQDYAQTIKYLGQIAEVRTFSVRRLALGSVLFSVRASGGDAALTQALRQSKHFQFDGMYNTQQQLIVSWKG